MIPRTPFRALLLGAALLAAGCGSTPPTGYVLLEPGVAGTEAPAGPRIGISRLELAEYLLAPQVQTRPGGNGLHRAAFAQWAEPLDEGVARVLRLDIGAAAGTPAVRLAPWPRDWVPDWELRLRVDRLDAGPESAELVVSWSLQDGARARTASDRITRLSVPRSGQGPEAVAADFSALLQEFARRVAAEIPPSAAGDAAPRSD